MPGSNALDLIAMAQEHNSGVVVAPDNYVCVYCCEPFADGVLAWSILAVPVQIGNVRHDTSVVLFCDECRGRKDLDVTKLWTNIQSLASRL